MGTIIQPTVTWLSVSGDSQKVRVRKDLLMGMKICGKKNLGVKTFGFGY